MTFEKNLNKIESQLQELNPGPNNSIPSALPRTCIDYILDLDIIPILLMQLLCCPVLLLQ